MPKKIDPELKARAVRLVSDHLGGVPPLIDRGLGRGCQTVGCRGGETVRRWVIQAQVDEGSRPGVTTEESAEIKRLKAENKRLREANEILKAASIFFAGELDPPQPLIVGFVDQMRAQGVCRRVGHGRAA